MPDPEAAIIGAFGVKRPLIKFTKRVTFVIGKDGLIKHVDRGKDALDIDSVVEACNLF